MDTEVPINLLQTNDLRIPGHLALKDHVIHGLRMMPQPQVRPRGAERNHLLGTHGPLNHLVLWTLGPIMTDPKILGVGPNHRIHGKKLEKRKEDPHLTSVTQAGFHQVIPKRCMIGMAGGEEAGVRGTEILGTIETRTAIEIVVHLGGTDSTEIGGIERGTDLVEVHQEDMIHPLKEQEVFWEPVSI